MTVEQTGHGVSLRLLVSRFRWRVLATAALVIAEAIVDLLFPLFIGIAINGLLNDSRGGVIALGALSIGAVVVGSVRRLYDTRVYSQIYETTAREMVATEFAQGTSVSVVAARTTLLVEFVEFLENSMPMIVTNVINVIGILVIVATIELSVFAACLGVFLLMVGVYWATGRRNHRLNKGYNDELERQVAALSLRSDVSTARHFGALMQWNIRLSDLETYNYAAIWIGIVGLLVYAPIALVDGTAEYGLVFAALVYVFQYIDGLLTMPLFIQQLIRLREISHRLAS